MSESQILLKPARALTSPNRNDGVYSCHHGGVLAVGDCHQSPSMRPLDGPWPQFARHWDGSSGLCGRYWPSLDALGTP